MGTVSKAKPDSEEFFKVIMGFPHPKPRNIEKDVKVFPWKILSVALKKIISKYSASYSSTASSPLTPTSSVYSNGEIVDYHYAPSPHPEYMAASGSYPVHTEVTYVPGPQAMRMQGPPPCSRAATSDARVCPRIRRQWSVRLSNGPSSSFRNNGHATWSDDCTNHPHAILGLCQLCQ